MIVFDELVIDCLEPTIKGLVDKIQVCMEKISEDTKDPLRLEVKKYLKLLEEMYRYAQLE